MISTFQKQAGKYSITNWVPVILWAGLIFYFSTEQFSSSQTSRLLGPFLSWLFPGISADRIQLVHLLLRKLGHLTEYLVFSILLLHALRQNYGGLAMRHVAWSVTFVVLYAVSDEFHQVFVPSRTAHINDLLIDVVGGICGTLWAVVYRKGNVGPGDQRESPSRAG
jgi:VanZ family protein